MLRSLRLERVKSWADTGQMKLAPITGLFGTNSSGKTSILQMLIVLKQTAESTDRAQVLNLGDDRALVDVGTFRDLVYGHVSPGAIDWSLTWSLPESLKVLDPEQPNAILFSTRELHFAARVMEIEGAPSPRLVVDSFQYRLEDEDSGTEYCFGMQRGNEKADQFELTASNFEFKRPRGRPPRLPAPVKCYGFPDQVFGYHQNAGFLAELQLAFEELLNRLYYLGPLREYPKRQYLWAGGQPSDMGRRGERTIDALLASRDRADLISRGPRRRLRPLEWVVADWLKKLGLVHTFEVNRISEQSNLYQVYVQKSSSSAKVLITDVGFGVSQILPVLTLCYYVPQGSTIILEQPEIHLHPSVQAGLADVLIDAVKTRHVQIVLESHSEHLLRRLQRRIAEEELPSTDVALYFCEMQNASSKLTPLQVDLYGNITNWPPDFFGDELGELAAMTEAAMKRELAEAAR
ncbi:MAG: DUF3696 domain-containing protein [Chloroflexi bacterium]|nr:DUF3696 domain-containing protein [Chloroflexota bacterium]